MLSISDSRLQAVQEAQDDRCQNIKEVGSQSFGSWERIVTSGTKTILSKPSTGGESFGLQLLVQFVRVGTILTLLVQSRVK
jgi:hypothetical protein